MVKSTTWENAPTSCREERVPPPRARLEGTQRGNAPTEMKDLVLMKERPRFTAAFVFSSPSLVPSFAALTSFCICREEGPGKGGGSVKTPCCS